MHLIDSHCHLDAPEFDADRMVVLQQAFDAGVRGIVVPAYQASRWRALLQWQAMIDQEHMRVWPTLGVHPLFLDSYQDQDIDDLARLLAQESSVVAVGEIGLDRYVPALREPVQWQRQVDVFEAQLALARQFDLPVILHARRCHSDIQRCLKRAGLTTGGIVHAFSGSLEEAEMYVRLGFRLGFGGAMTYSGAHRIRAVAAQLPLSALVIETDAPDMLPSACRPVMSGMPVPNNSPANLPLVFESLLGLRNESAPELVQALWRNTMESLHLEVLM